MPMNIYTLGGLGGNQAHIWHLELLFKVQRLRGWLSANIVPSLTPRYTPMPPPPRSILCGTRGGLVLEKMTICSSHWLYPPHNLTLVSSDPTCGATPPTTCARFPAESAHFRSRQTTHAYGLIRFLNFLDFLLPILLGICRQLSRFVWDNEAAAEPTEFGPLPRQRARETARQRAASDTS